MFENQTILITGGTGSWGHEVTRQLLDKNPKEIRIYSRSELSQVNMQRKFQSTKLTFVIGDVRDYEAVNEAMKGVDYVFHLAALKHVPVCEVQPVEAIKTNILGTEHVIRAAIQNRVKKVIDISTDKAVDPINLYGMTKAVGERLILQANDKSELTKFICVRGGNVLGTNGSVVPLFKSQLATVGTITITDRRMTRFFLTLSEAIGLLFKATEEGIGGEIFIMRMPACKITDLAQVLIDHSGKDGVNVIETGMRQGEKLHEILLSPNESANACQLDSNYFVIFGQHPSRELIDKYGRLPPVPYASYSSAEVLMDYGEIREMLRKGGMLT